MEPRPRLPSTDGPLVVLTDAGTAVERELVDGWLRQAREGHRGPVQVLSLRDGPGPDALGPDALHPDALLLPVRVVWLPRERDGVRRARWSDLVTLTDPRRPGPRAQARIVRREPDRARVIAAEAATVAELRQRWADRNGPPGDAAFAGFVRRQATLALERAGRAVVGDRYKVPKLIAEEVLASATFRSEAAALARRLELSEEEVVAAAAKDLRCLVAGLSPLAVDLFTGMLRPLHARAWSVRMDTDGLERLRELNRRHPLVFLPSHRSYVDPLVLADVLAEHDFPRNHVLGGENLAFWPIAPLARRAGIVFIRRSFRDDEVYKLVVREYFGYLLSKRFNLEWYLEGGRSRTGKLRPPRYGLLGYVTEALRCGRCEDVYLVPTSIAYDQLREVTALAAEQRGAAKRREGLGWLADYARHQLTPVGEVQVRFAEPISLRSHLGGGQAHRLALQKVAFEVAVGINRVTPVLATALVTLALLGVRDRALTLDQVGAVLEPVLDYVEDRKLPQRGLDLLRRPAGVRRVLEALCRERVVTVYDGGEQPVYAIDRDQHLVAAFYRNSAIHHFVNRAIVELMLVCGAADPWQEAFRLRDLLKFEFFFPDRETFRAELVDELRRIDPDWERVPGHELLGRVGFLMAHRVLRSFLDAQLVVAQRLAARDPRAPVVDKEFLAECAGVGQQLLLQGRLHGPESISAELFANALKLAANYDLVGPGDLPDPGDLVNPANPVDPGRELRARREAFAAELAETVARVAAIDEIDATSRRETVGVEP